MNEKEKIELLIPKTYFENKNMLLGGIIRIAREIVLKSEVPGIIKEFGDETPISTLEIRTLFGFGEDKSKFNYHFNAFKKYIKVNYDREIIPLIKGTSGADIYTKGVVKEFLVYMNRNEIKFKIEL